jgi:tubulin-specific chaperone A
VLNRLVKEEKSYHKELEQQNVKIAKLEAGEDADNENAEFILRQQVSSIAGNFCPDCKALQVVRQCTNIYIQKQAVEQTKAVFPALNQKIQDALTKLEEQLVGLIYYFSLGSDNDKLTHFQEQDKDSASSEEVTKAKEALAAGHTAAKESSL